MKKKEKWLYFTSGFVSTIVVTILIALILVWTGVITMPKAILKIESGSYTREYNGTPLVSHEYTIVENNLEEGHRIEVITYGEQTEKGSSSNYFTVIVRDVDGNVVTSNYQIIKICGTLTVV